MTTIKSSPSPSPRSLDVIVRNDGLVNLSINDLRHRTGIQISTAALCAALGFEEAVRSRAEARLADAESRNRQYAEKVDAQIELLEDLDDQIKAMQVASENSHEERKALTTTLDRVRTQAVEMRCCATAATDPGARFAWNQAAGMIEAALAGPKPFELPKEYGTRFWARNASDVWIEFKTRRNYSLPPECEQRIFVTPASAAYDDRKVMSLFKDHTLEAPQVKASERV